MLRYLNPAVLFQTCFVLFFFALLVIFQPPAQAQASDPLPAKPTIDSESYRLGAGDKIHLTVYGEDDLTGDFTIDGSGNLRLPLIGQVTARGLAVHDLESQIALQFRQGGYLKDPKISLEVINYRPFDIIGEVNKPGEYPFVNGMSVLNAVALAGGYTYRAKDDYVYVRRNGATTEEKLKADQSTKIYPGDIVRVDEQFF